MLKSSRPLNAYLVVMRRRFTVNQEGLLESRDGEVLGRVVGLTIEAPEVSGAVGGKGGTLFSSEVGKEEESGRESEGGADEDRVWEHYVRTMRPRKTELLSEMRAVISKALKVASADELCGAINGCAASTWHMGENPSGRKYNELSSIIRGRRGHETTRERIDFFLESADVSSQAATFDRLQVSAIPAMLAPHELDVVRRQALAALRMHERPDSEAARAEGEQALATLRRGYGLEPVISDGRIAEWRLA